MEKHSDERSESAAVGEVRTYVQKLLTPPEHARFTVNVLYDASTRTARYQVDVTDPSTRELLAMESRPFHHDITAQDALMAACTIARRLSGELELGDPF